MVKKRKYVKLLSKNNIKISFENIIGYWYHVSSKLVNLVVILYIIIY
jgi:hypothetical protein